MGRYVRFSRGSGAARRPVDRSADDTVSVSRMAAPRVDAKALWIIFCGAGDAPSNDSGSLPLGLRVSDARGLESASGEMASMMRGRMRRIRK